MYSGKNNKLVNLHLIPTLSFLEYNKRFCFYVITLDGGLGPESANSIGRSSDRF